MNGANKWHSPDGPAFAPGEKWVPADGSPRTVEIVSTRRYGSAKWDVEVVYCDPVSGETWDKDAWNFQVRYTHEADKNL